MPEPRRRRGRRRDRQVSSLLLTGVSCCSVAKVSWGPRGGSLDREMPGTAGGCAGNRLCQVSRRVPHGFVSATAVSMGRGVRRPGAGGVNGTCSRGPSQDPCDAGRTRQTSRVKAVPPAALLNRSHLTGLSSGKTVRLQVVIPVVRIGNHDPPSWYRLTVTLAALPRDADDVARQCEDRFPSACCGGRPRSRWSNALRSSPGI